MPQHDYSIDNQLFPATRTDINAALAAIASLNSGSTAPSNPVPFMPWADTSTSPATIRQRNAANTAWVVVGTADTNNLGLATIASPALTGTPTTPTAASSTNTTQIASTAFVQATIKTMTAWTNAFLSNSWVNLAGNTPIRYRQDNTGTVYVQGLCRKPSAISAGETIFQLPAGMRPVDNVNRLGLAIAVGGSNWLTTLNIIYNSNGNVTIVNAVAAGIDYMEFFHVFKAEQ